MPETRQQRLEELLTQWRERSQNGETLSAADLCAQENDSELLDDLSRLIREVGMLSNFAALSTLAEGANKDTPSPDTGRPPPQIDGYRIERYLDKGGMGIVYKACETRTGRVVALKMIKSQGLKDPGELVRFRREFEALAQLQHPNIVPMYHVDEVSPGEPYFTMEYLPGGDLRTRIGGKPMDARESAALVEMLARAMDAVHKLGIIHRDLKPGNVLLAADGTPKIADFGLAKKLDGSATETTPGMVIGTLAYASPEQIQSSATADLRADVYSLGAILYECLTGQPPYQGKSNADVILEVMTGAVKPPRERERSVPKGLNAICLMCLQKNPAKRYQSAGDLADDLARWQRGRPVKAFPQDVLHRVGRTFRSPVWVLGYLVLVGLICMAGFRWLFPEPPPPPSAFEVMEREFEEGKVVQLLGSDFKPRLLDWPIAEGANYRTARESFSFHANDAVLARLYPTIRGGRFRFSAKVRHEEGDTLSEVGIFAALEEFPIPKGKAVLCCAWTFNDVVKIPGNVPRLSFHLIRHDTSSGIPKTNFFTEGGGKSIPFDPAMAPIGTGPFRELAIVIDREYLRTFWGATPVHSLDRDAIRKRVNQLSMLIEGQTLARLTFNPTGGIGVFLSAGSASFKHVTLQRLAE